MNRNDEIYSTVDYIEKPRSNWDRDFTHKTTFNAGKLVPFFLDMDIIPGTTIKNKTTMLVRLNTPLNPTMDNMYLDYYYFKCSKFWYWDNFRQMMGENKYGAWAQTVDYEEPKIITTSANPTSVNDFATYIGVRMGTPNLKWSKTAINCYIDVWNNYFRDQNLMAPIQFDTTDANLTADGTIQTGFGLLPTCKLHDYFTSALLQPEKSANPVRTPLGLTAPIKGYTQVTSMPYEHGLGNVTGVKIETIDGTNIPAGYKTLANNAAGVSKSSIAVYNQGSAGTGSNHSSDVTFNNLWADFWLDSTQLGLANAYADLSQATAATINALRLAFATQRILERDLNGTRYREILLNHYGVCPSDESINIPEYLGGKRIPISINQIVQTSSTDSTSPLGYTGAMSITMDVNEDFTKSFTKDDILIGVLTVRADHTYSQMLPRQLTRTGRLDRYWPELSHIGNQPIYNYEIFATGTSTDNEVFGYKEAWQEYMYKPNMISGEMLPDYAQSLDIWHYGDDYSSLPVLSEAWIKEPVEFIDRTLAVTSQTANQFKMDCYIEQNITAPIPLHRFPGLIDHY